MHVELTLYFIYCITTSLFYPHGTITTILLTMLLIIHQYFFYLLHLEPPKKEPSSFCTECKGMTTNSYVHCRECHLCFPVTHFHWDVFNHCVSKENAIRYRNIVLLQMGINLFCSLLQSIAYPPFIIVFVTTIISCKSTASKLQLNI